MFFISFFYSSLGAESPDQSPEGGATCWWAPWSAMGCFGSAGSKQSDSNGSDDTKSQKRRSDAITRQLQKDKQVNIKMPLNN